RPRLELERRKHGAEFVHRQRIVAVHQHVPTPISHADNEHFDLEVGGGLPWTKDFKDSLLGILVFERRTLGAFKPTEHIFHRFPPVSVSRCGTSVHDPSAPGAVAKSVIKGCGGAS